MRKTAIILSALAAFTTFTQSTAHAKQLIGEGACPNGKRYAVWYDASWGGEAYGAGTPSFGPSYFASTPEQAVREFCR